MLTIVIFIISFIAMIALVIINIYNSFIKKDKLIEEAWHGIDIQLKKRYDLIPSLVETVKGYAKHEKSTLEDIVKLRNETNSVADFDEKIKNEAQLSKMVKGLFALSEAYPELKSNQNFIELQKSLENIEDEIQLSRRYYNANVRDYNTLVNMFPTNLIAQYYNFIERKFFGIENEQERQNVKVSF